MIISANLYAGRQIPEGEGRGSSMLKRRQLPLAMAMWQPSRRQHPFKSKFTPYWNQKQILMPPHFTFSLKGKADGDFLKEEIKELQHPQPNLSESFDAKRFGRKRKEGIPVQDMRWLLSR